MLNIFVFYFVYLVYINNFNNKGLDYVKKKCLWFNRYMEKVKLIIIFI